MFYFVMLREFFFFKQKTAYEMRISDWSSDVCSSDLTEGPHEQGRHRYANRSRTSKGQYPHQARKGAEVLYDPQIGRASCRERVCQRVDLGGRSIIKKKKKTIDKQTIDTT